jgi:thioredoxin-related protein
MRMETGAFLKDEVIEYINSNYIAMKYESGKDGEQFMRFNVRGTPTFLVLDAEGNEQHRMVGFMGHEELLKQLQRV